MGAAPILTILKNGETIKSCAIEGEAMLGRAEGCVIRLEDRAISRQHAVFRVIADGVQVEKKSEFAPMMINGAEVTGKATLKEADVISIGPYLMRVSMPKAVPDVAIALPAAAVAESATTPLAAVPAAEGESAIEVSSANSGQSQVSSPALEMEPIPDNNVSGIEVSGQSPDAGLGGGVGLDSPPAEIAPGSGAVSMDFEASQIEQIADDAKTKLTPAAKLSVHLIFPQGTANVTDFELTQDEISIGRGKNCDIVLEDKKASRKNAIIRRAGLSFTIKDLESANGTFVNGVQVREQELTGDDLIRIGNVEFQFKAMSADYDARVQDFMPVPEDPIEEPNPHENPNPFGMPLPDQVEHQSGALTGSLPPGEASHATGLAGITGIGPGDTKRMSFIEKIRNFRSLPPRQQLLLAVIIAGLVYFIAFDEDTPEQVAKVPHKKGAIASTGSAAVKGPPTFEALSPEKQRFIEAQHSLAFSYYTNKKYDQALFELEKIFAYVQDYHDSRDIERYAREGKRKLDAFEEEKRKKEEEVRLKEKITLLVEECRRHMEKKEYEPARDLFSQITVLDPDNLTVQGWKKEIESYEEKRRADEQTKQVQAEINKHAWEVYAEGLTLKKQGKYHSAITIFGKVGDIGASDTKVTTLAAKMARACHSAIKSKRDPVLAEAKQLEDAGEFAKAFALYKKATVIDPPHPAGFAGIGRIRGILHDRAKIFYTEAILAESFSDFANAKKKYKECLEVAPADDIYHERATRKLSHYFRKDEQQ